MDIYKIVRLHEKNELDTLTIEELEQAVTRIEEELEDQREEIEFYGNTEQRSNDLDTLLDIESWLGYYKNIKTNEPS